MTDAQFQIIVRLISTLIRAMIWKEDPAGKLMSRLVEIEKLYDIPCSCGREGSLDHDDFCG